MYKKIIPVFLLSGSLLSGMSAGALTPQMANNIMLSSSLAAAKGVVEASKNNAQTAKKTTDKQAESTVSNDKQTVSSQSIAFSSVESKVRANNPTIKGFEKTLASINSTDVELQFLQQNISYNNQNNMLAGQKAEYDRVVSGLRDAAYSANDEASKKAFDTLADYFGSLSSQTQGTIAMNSGIMAGLKDAEEDAEDKLKETYTSTKKQLENAADQLVMGAQTQYITLITIDNSIKTLERSIAAIDRSLPVVEKQLEIGMASELDLKTLKNQRETAQSSLESIKTQKTTLESSLSVMLGNEANTTVTAEGLPAVSYDVKNINYKDDLKKAMENSYAIWSKQDEVRKASNDYDDDVTSTLDAYDSAKYNLEAAKTQAETSFKSLYDTLMEKQRLLDKAKSDLTLAEQNFKVSEVKYNTGNLSKIEYESAKDTLESSKDAIKTAEVDLFTAYNNYQWGIKGVM